MDNNIFKIGKFGKIQNETQIEELENGCLYFFINSKSEPNYSLEFKGTINKEDFYHLKLEKK